MFNSWKYNIRYFYLKKKIACRSNDWRLQEFDVFVHMSLGLSCQVIYLIVYPLSYPCFISSRRDLLFLSMLSRIRAAVKTIHLSLSINQCDHSLDVFFAIHTNLHLSAVCRETSSDENPWIRENVYSSFIKPFKMFIFQIYGFSRATWIIVRCLRSGLGKYPLPTCLLYP